MNHKKGDAQKPEKPKEQSHFFINMNSLGVLCEIEFPLSPESNEREDDPVDPRGGQKNKAEGNGPKNKPREKTLFEHAPQSEAKGDLKINP